MAKGDPSGLYFPETYTGEPNAQMVEWLVRELTRVGASFEMGLCRNVEFLNVAPDKPREGMTVGADGTNWNPGSGQGVYTYYAGSWHKLG